MILLFAVWLGGALLTKSSFIHLVLLTAIALFVVHLARRHRCGEPYFTFDPGKRRNDSA